MKLSILSILLIFFSVCTYGQKRNRLFIDTLDNAFDISHYMYNLNGLLPIVSPITEPAVGFGAALATVYFIPKKKNDSVKFQMPDIAALAAGLTQNGTWFVGGGYLGFWNKDKIRYRGVLGYGDVKLQYFGAGNEFLSENPINFSLNSTFILQQALFRLANSRFMIGGKYIYSKSKVTIFDGIESDWINPIDINLRNSGIGVIGEFENYDNFLSPNKGVRVNINYIQFSEILGGDVNFGKGTFFALFYVPTITNKLISGFRFESQIATGSAPFYMKPFVFLRGVPAMKYQGDVVNTLETEQLFLINRRWGLVGFGGIGSTHNYDSENSNIISAWNYGGGFRYLIARRLGLRMGIDVGKSAKDWGVYIIFGSAWIK